MSELQLEINGVTYSGFTSATATTSIENKSGSFSFTISSLNSLNKYPLKAGDKCRILANGQSIINGYIETFGINYNSSDHTISIGGRDKTCDVIDSTISGQELTFNSSISLIDITKKVLSTLGITDINVTCDVDLSIFDKSEISDIAAQTGETAFEFIEKFAIKRNVLITTDGNGNIVFTRVSDKKINTVISTQSNYQPIVVSSSVDYDETKRFYKYVLYTQNNCVNDSVLSDTSHIDNSQQVNKVSTAYDETARHTRILNFLQGETSYNNLKDLQDRATYEANYRLSRCFKYTAEVRDFTPVNDKNLIWRPNYLVNVIDEFCDINSCLLINKVTYNYSIDNGSTCTLELIDKDSYGVDVIQGVKLKNKHKTYKQGNDVVTSLEEFQK